MATLVAIKTSTYPPFQVKHLSKTAANLAKVQSFSQNTDKMKVISLILLGLVAFAYCEEEAAVEIKEEEDVQVLTDANWEKAVTEENNILVEFCK